MPVDIPSLYTQAGSLKRPATGAAPTGGTLPLAPGEQARAQVLKSTPLNAALSAKLLSAGAGAEGGQSPTPSGETAESARSALLNSYRSAMARNEMHLAALLIRGKNVTTVVDQPLLKGQFLNVQLTQQGKLMALNAKLDAPAPAQPASSQSTALIAALKPVLRELLPRQGQQDLLSQLQRLPNLSPSVTQVGGDKSLSKLLGQIEQIALNLNAPASGKAVRTALEQSGTLLEPKLARALTSPVPDTAVKEVLAKDLKAALLQYLAPLRPTGINPTPAGAATAAPSSPAASQPVAGELALPSLMQMLSSHSQNSGGESLRMLQTQLVLLMHQLSLNTLARVRLNQLQPEARSARGAEPVQAPLNFDIPVRLDGHLYPAHIEIEEYADEDHDAEPSAETLRVWQVNLTLEPPGIGEFFVRLRLRADQLSVAFWSEQPRALAKAESAFADIRNTLAKQDIDVRDVQFHQGVPPHKGNQLSYHLVDIKT